MQINPIIGLDYPDPDVIRVGDVYYMVSTTMHFMPGCELLRSYDLVCWEHVSYVYDRLDGTPGQKLEDANGIYGKGMWAASLRFHKGIFYICFVANDTGKTYLYSAKDIHGPWKKQCIEGFYHDCSLLFDDDGRVYIAYGNTEIRIRELRADLSGPKEGGLDRVAVRDAGNPMLGYEGTHFYKIGGRYYLFLIHSRRDCWRRVEACFAAESLEAEFAGGDVLDDDRGYCGQGVAQGGIVDTPDGKWFAMLFQDHGAAGRIPVLVPVAFAGGFPVFGDAGRVPASFETPPAKADYAYRPLTDSDDFRQRGPLAAHGEELSADDSKSYAVDGRLTVSEAYDTYGFKSCWQINHEPDLALIENDCEKGFLSITSGKVCANITQARNIFTQRMCFPQCGASVTVDGTALRDGDYAGISVFAGCYGMAAVTRRGGRYYVVLTENGASSPEEGCREEERACIPVEGGTVRFMVTADFEGMRDEALFWYEDNGAFVRLGPPKKLYFWLDHFAGCRFGLFMYATKQPGGTARFSDFVYASCGKI